jgi:hypothetical protein
MESRYYLNNLLNLRLKKIRGERKVQSLFYRKKAPKTNPSHHCLPREGGGPVFLRAGRLAAFMYWIPVHVRLRLTAGDEDNFLVSPYQDIAKRLALLEGMAGAKRHAGQRVIRQGHSKARCVP